MGERATAPCSYRAWLFAALRRRSLDVFESLLFFLFLGAAFVVPVAALACLACAAWRMLGSSRRPPSVLLRFACVLTTVWTASIVGFTVSSESCDSRFAMFFGSLLGAPIATVIAACVCYPLLGNCPAAKLPSSE